MGTLFEDTNPRDLKELLQQIHSCEAALPAFQRSFVWDPDATQALIASIGQSYPAGSLLRIRNTHELFAHRAFEEAPPLNGRKPTYLVLDGQQRLTSLYQAFYGVGEHRYYLDLQKLLDGGDFDECLFHVASDDRLAKRYEHVEAQAEDLVLPLKVLRRGTGEFSTWVLDIVRRAKTQKERAALEDRLMPMVQNEDSWIQRIDDYKFPVVTLSEKTDADAVCTIFETLNRTGIKLSVFELLTARFWPKKVDLRDLWDSTQRDHPLLSLFEVDPYYILQVVALISKKKPSCKRSDVLDLDAEVMTRWWPRAAEGIADGIEILRDDCGLLIPDWLPYSTMLIPLGATLARTTVRKGPAVGANRRKLTRWFWCSAFGGKYENAANSQAAKDMVELLDWLDKPGAEEPESVAKFRFEKETLRSVTPRQRALYRAAICLVLRNGPLDFHERTRLTADLIRQHRVDDHHVFPQAYLAKRGYTSPSARDCVLNRTLIDRTTNIRISDRAPSAYLAEMRQALKDDFRPLLASHVLPGDPDSPLLADDFEGFLDWREAAMFAQLEDAIAAK